MSVFESLGRLPPAAATLGWRYDGFVEDRSALRVSFVGREEFTTPSGHVHGGFIAAMLNEVMASTVTAVTSGASLGASVSMSVDFIRPVLPGHLQGEGSITLLGKNIAFVEGRLLSGDSLVARSTGSCRLVPVDPSWLHFDESPFP